MIFDFFILMSLLLISESIQAQVLKYDKFDLDKKEDMVYMTSLIVKGNDNLKKLSRMPSNLQNDSSLLVTYNFLTRVYQNWYGKTDSLKKYALLTLETSKIKHNIEYFIRSKIALEYYYQIKKGDFITALEINFEILKLIEINQKYAQFRSKAYYNIGAIYLQIKEYDKALQYFSLAESNYNDKDYPKEYYSVILQKIGNIYLVKSNYNEAEKKYLQAINLINDGSSESIRGYILQDLGNLYFKKNKNYESLNYFLEAEAVFRKLKKERPDC